MAKVTLNPDITTQLALLDAKIEHLNHEKIRLLLRAIGMEITPDDLQQLLGWTLILVTVKDQHMGGQLNKYCAYVPNLKFVVDKEKELFTVMPGKKGRRVWKER